MTQAQQIQSFSDDLKRLIDRYRSEFDLTVAGAVGVLEIAKLDLYTSALREAEEEEDE